MGTNACADRPDAAPNVNTNAAAEAISARSTTAAAALMFAGDEEEEEDTTSPCTPPLLSLLNVDLLLFRDADVDVVFVVGVTRPAALARLEPAAPWWGV